MTPRYEHDTCNNCRLIGAVGSHDLWVCQCSDIPFVSFAIRSSSVPQDYISNNVSIDVWKQSIQNAKDSWPDLKPLELQMMAFFRCWPTACLHCADLP